MKNLEQIQKENRKAIIDANGGDLAIDGPYEYFNLAQVLIATQHKIFSGIMSEKESVLHVEYNLGIDDPFWIEWDLTKPTLEQQDEQTQIAINELLTKQK